MLNRKSSFNAQITPNGVKIDTIIPTTSKANMLAKIFSLFIARSLLHNLHLKIVLYRICRHHHILHLNFPCKRYSGGNCFRWKLD